MQVDSRIEDLSNEDAKKQIENAEKFYVKIGEYIEKRKGVLLAL